MTLLTKKPEDGIIYVTPEELHDYVFDSYKEELQKQSGMTQEVIDKQREDMMHGRRDVTFRNYLVKVRV